MHERERNWCVLACVPVCANAKGRHGGKKFVIMINEGLNKVETERERVMRVHN